MRVRGSRQTTPRPDRRESLDNLTPADVSFGRGLAILLEGEGIAATLPSLF